MTEYERVQRRIHVSELLAWALLQGPAYSPLQALVRLRGLLEEVHGEGHNAVAALRYVKRVSYYVRRDDVTVTLELPAAEPFTVTPAAVRAAEAQPAARQQSLPYG